MCDFILVKCLILALFPTVMQNIQLGVIYLNTVSRGTSLTFDLMDTRS